MAEGSGLLNRQGLCSSEVPLLSAIFVGFEVLYEKEMYLFEN